MPSIKNRIASIFPNLCFFVLRKYLDLKFIFCKDQKKRTSNRYLKRFGTPLNIDEPRTFYEKINYLKFNYDDKSSSVLIDKYLVKELLIENGYSNMVTKPIGHYFSFKDFKKDLPGIISNNNNFVVKLTHTSGDVFFYNEGNWRDKKGNKTSKKYVLGRLKQNLKFNYYHLNFEKIYNRLKGAILVEEYIPSLSNLGMDEIKIFLNYGKPVLVNYVVGRQNKGKVKEAFLSPELVKYDTRQNQAILEIEKLSKPVYYEKMLEFCKKMCSDIPLVRADFMCNKDSFMFCEFTFFDCSGMNIFYPEKYNIIFGDLISLTKEE